MSRPVYTYQVVTSNGAGRHGGSFTTPRAARAYAESCAERMPAAGPFEIERVEHVGQNGRRYSMREGSRWVQWDPHRDATVRNPDWIWPQ